MSKVVGRTEIELRLKKVANMGRLAGILREGDRLIYERGSRVNGISHGVSVQHAGFTSRGHAPFLPRFNLSHTAKDVALALEAVERTLFEINYYKESR